MDWWYPIVIGSVAFSYIQLFNYNAKKHLVRAGIEPARLLSRGS